MPYTPEHKRIIVVPLEFCEPLQIAKEYAEKHAKDPKYKLASVMVLGQYKDQKSIICKGANGSDYHTKHGCERQRLGTPTGEGHHLCPGCSSVNHSEQQAIKYALSLAPPYIIKGFDLYMWGHYHCCKSCWKEMLKYKVGDVFIAKEVLDKRHEFSQADNEHKHCLPVDLEALLKPYLLTK